MKIRPPKKGRPVLGCPAPGRWRPPDCGTLARSTRLALLLAGFGRVQYIDAMASTIRIRAAWDDEAGVWFVEESDVFGVNAEAAMEELRDKLPNVIADVLADNDPSRLRHDLTVEIIARFQTRIPATDAA